MKILIDTHVLIWYAEGNRQLPSHIQYLLAKESNDIFLSIASLWEMGIKISKGKLDLNLTPQQILQFAAQRVIILPAESDDAITISTLPFHHNDPFDRMILAQGLNRNLTIISKDNAFKAYGADILW